MCAMTPVLLIMANMAFVMSQAQAAPPRRVKLMGQVAAVSPGKILVTDEQSKVRIFNILPDKQVSIAVKGQVTLADLKPGMLARIEGSLKMNALEGEVTKITVYSLNDGYVAGIIQDAPDQPTVVTGIVKLLKDDSLTLMAGKKRISATLAKDVAVIIDSKDYTLAPTGSLIDADGYETKDGSVNARKLVITIGKVEKKETKSQEAKTAKAEKEKAEKK